MCSLRLRLIIFHLLVANLNAQIVINEIHHSPDDKTTRTEFIELLNIGNQPLSLGGWAITGAVNVEIKAGTTIDPEGFILLAEDPGFLAQNFNIPANIPICDYEGQLSGDGETIRLMNGSGDLIDEVSYRAEFPWPIPAGGDGPSMELMNVNTDNDLGGSWRSSMGTPTPGASNSVTATNTPPLLRQIRHTPQVPTETDDIQISVKASDPDGIGSLTLRYQINSPGAFIPSRLPLNHTTLINSPSTSRQENPAFEDPANWNSIVMTLTPGETDIFTAVIPAQIHRTLVRYRIFAQDTLGAEVRAPALDDPSLNFAIFVYNGVPEYEAATSVHPNGNGHRYSTDLLTSLPVHTIITRADDLQTCYAYDGTIYESFQIAKSNKAARKIFNWQCAVVFDGIVYDHVNYRLRQNNNRFTARGKRSMRFRFNRGHYFQARDEEGQKWPTKWRTLNTGKMSTFNSPTTYGLREVVNSRIWRMAGIECPYFYHFHFRVIDDVAEAPNQHEGDFFGLGMAFEEIDGRLLEARNLPDGNLYKWKDGESTALELKRNQERFSVNDGSDFSTYRFQLNNSRSISELENMVDWNQWSLYHTICEAIRHYDFGTASTHQKNMAWYFQPNEGSAFGKLRLIPHDHDATWSRGYHDRLRVGIGRDYPWRAIFSQSTDVGDPSDRSPLKAPLNLIYRNTMRNFRDLFWQPESINLLIDETLDSIENFTFADRDRWTGGTPASGVETQMNAPTSISGSMKQIAFTNDLVDGENLVGGRATFLDRLSQDVEIPNRPSIQYTGPPDFPPGELSFSTSSFTDPQGSQTYSGTEWRVARVSETQQLIRNLITTGHIWHYRDTGENLQTEWKEVGFNVQSWKSGASPLGYQENGLATEIERGQPQAITNYFVTTIDMGNLEPQAEYRLQILRDDGAVVYINGTELVRLGMSPGPVFFDTPASENAPENIYDQITFTGELFQSGINTIAIELHQRSVTSSDTKIDLIIDEFSPPPVSEPYYEWNATWSAQRDNMSPVTMPALATRTGGLYRARVRHRDQSGRYSRWSAPFTFTAGQANTSSFQDQLVIAEFAPTPASASASEQDDGFSTSDFEYIRLKNIGASSLSLSDVRFTKGIDIDLSGDLSPGEELIVANNPAAYLRRNPGADTPAGPWDGKLKNEGELLKLSFGAGEPIREFTYFDSPAWPQASEEFSLALIAPDHNPDHKLPTSWRPNLATLSSQQFTGSPSQDTDADGMSDLLEFALGTDPNSFSSSPMVLNPDSLSFSRNARASDAVLMLEKTNNLIDWDPVETNDILSSTVDPNGQWQTVYQVEIDGETIFYRLSVAQ